MATDRDTLVELNDVTKLFDVTPSMTARLLGRDHRPVHAVESVDLKIERGEVVGIAGESGCGKTTLGKLLVKLHDPTHGDIIFDGKDISELTRQEEQEFRQRVQMIFQDPFESLNPRMTVMDTVAEPLRINDLPDDEGPTDHPVDVTGANSVSLPVEARVMEDAAILLEDGVAARVRVSTDASGSHAATVTHEGTTIAVDLEGNDAGLSASAEVGTRADGEAVLRVALNADIPEYEVRRQRIIEVLEDVGLKPAETYLDQFPRELSGGERQRVAIARALVVDPEFIVADEPVSMLDVSIRASVLNLMQDLRDEYDLTYVFISHDLSLIRYMCDRTCIMYLGDMVEKGDTDEVVDNPQHPYTEALFDAVPKVDPKRERHRANVTGEVPSARNPPRGCKFHPRCSDIIEPDEWPGDQQSFRRFFQFKRNVSLGELEPEELEVEDEPRDQQIEAILSRGLALDVPEEHRLEGEDPKEGVTLSEVDMPSGPESLMREAAETVIDGESESAFQRLDDEYQSICELHHPEMRPAANQSTACHLYGETERAPTAPAPSDD